MESQTKLLMRKSVSSAVYENGISCWKVNLTAWLVAPLLIYYLNICNIGHNEAKRSFDFVTFQQNEIRYLIYILKTRNKLKLNQVTKLNVHKHFLIFNKIIITVNSSGFRGWFWDIIKNEVKKKNTGENVHVSITPFLM